MRPQLGGHIATVNGHFGPQTYTSPTYTSAGTYYLTVSCGGYGGTGVSQIAVTVVTSGGGGGGGGSNPCAEQGATQIWASYIGQSFNGSPTPPSNLVAGQQFTASVTFRNDGACTWTAANSYRAGSQNPENNINWGTSRLYLNPADAIPTGQSKTFTFTAQAPTTAGCYGWGWRMVREYVNWFGNPTNGSFATICVSGSVPPQPVLPTINSFTISPQARWSDDPASTMSWSSSTATSCDIASSPTSGGSWSSLGASGSLTLSPAAGTYTYTLTCRNSAGAVSQDAVFGVADATPYQGTQATGSTSTSTLSFDAATKVRCMSHYHEEVWKSIGGTIKLRVYQDVRWCFNTKTHTLVCGSIACPVYRTIDHSDPGLPWSWDSWNYGSCSATTCTDMQQVWTGASSARVWAKGTMSAGINLNLGLITIPLTKHVSLVTGTTVFGDGTYLDFTN